MLIRTWQSEEYRPYWQTRDHAYLDRVEHRLLSLLIDSGDWFVDLGGGYGRLLEVYRDSFANIIITDYSMSMLEAAEDHLSQHEIRNVHLVAADIHRLPLADCRFDGAMMVRVIHHVEDPAPVIAEVHRILRPNGTFVLEYQNKRNLSARIKAKLGRIPSAEMDTPAPREAGPLYWEFHPLMIEQALAGRFSTQQVLGGGVFWNRKILASLLPHPELLDVACARFLGRHTLTHQLFLRLQALKQPSMNAPVPPGESDPVIARLRCLKCGKSELQRMGDRLICGHCRHSYPVKGTIYDFRET